MSALNVAALGEADLAGERAADERYQHHILQGVSRTFALTIPQLGPQLRAVVGNAYLLCRIVDTVEDEATLKLADKKRFSEQFVAVVAGEIPASEFAHELYPLLSAQTLDEERDLVRHTDAVLRITHAFNSVQQAALKRCIRIMAEGMAYYQESASMEGLARLSDLDRYCYHVAGVVGEMLTELFCDSSVEINRQREKLMPLSVSFGQGLQMTNILKDVWEDHERGVCWLPQELFARHEFDLSKLQSGQHHEGFAKGMQELIGVARYHLERALEYTLLLPPDETGIRKFCLWALGMAVLTLRKIHGRLDFSTGVDVKISRRSVKATVLVSNLLVQRDTGLRWVFVALSHGLPPVPAYLLQGDP